ncbi:hypothetical protein NC651_003955 [Populus alba x Populus x berolinensis]|nr:hypothetical protein NC651_003955 [Populus alba x Populus x berolinensis]
MKRCRNLANTAGSLDTLLEHALNSLFLLILLKRASQIRQAFLLVLLRRGELALFIVWGRMCKLIRSMTKDIQRLHTPIKGMTRGNQRLYVTIWGMIKERELLGTLVWIPCMWKLMNGRL